MRESYGEAERPPVVEIPIARGLWHAPPAGSEGDRRPCCGVGATLVVEDGWRDCPGWGPVGWRAEPETESPQACGHFGRRVPIVWVLCWEEQGKFVSDVTPEFGINVSKGDGGEKLVPRNGTTECPRS